MHDDFDTDGQEAADALREMANSTNEEASVNDLVQELRNWQQGTVGKDYVGHISCDLVNRAVGVIEQQAKEIERLKDLASMVYGNIEGCKCCSTVAEVMVEWESWLGEDE